MAQYAKIQPETLRTRVMQLGVTSVIFAIGFAMTGYINFWRGVILMSAVVAIYLGNLWFFEKKIEKREKVGQTLVLLGSYAILLWLVFVPAPLTVLIDRPQGNYPAGLDFLGVQWKADYYPVNFVIINETESDYNDFDSYIQTNLHFAKIGIKTSLNQCEVAKELAEIGMALPQVSGEGVTIPLFEENSNTISSFYHVRCSRIAPRSRVQFVLATVGGKPDWGAIEVRYMAVGRERHNFFPQCFSKACPSMPKKSLGMKNPWG
jgi:hypothetical protein